MSSQNIRSLVVVLIIVVAIIGLFLGVITQLARPNKPLVFEPILTSNITDTAVATGTHSVAIVSPTIPAAEISCDNCSVPEIESTVANTATEQIVATINEQAISALAWQQTTQLDALMSQLARRPVPTAEETLDRLVNETLILQAVSTQAVNEADVNAKLTALTSQWQLSDQAIAQALQAVGLSQADLANRVRHLLQVESALQQLSTDQADVNTWLAQTRASAKIGLYNAMDNATAAIPTSTPRQELPAPPPDLAVSPNEGNVAPDFTLTKLDGQPVTLSNLRGKPTLINFWATWCPPCRSELPTLQAAYQKYGDQIGFIAVDVKEDAPTVSAFVEQLGLTFPIAIDANGSVSDSAYQVLGIPTTLFIDERGVVSKRHVGPLDEATLEGYLAPLLGQPAVETGHALSLPVISAELKIAPTFALTAADGSRVALADMQAANKTTVLVFYRGHT